MKPWFSETCGCETLVFRDCSCEWVPALSHQLAAEPMSTLINLLGLSFLTGKMGVIIASVAQGHLQLLLVHLVHCP